MQGELFRWQGKDGVTVCLRHLSEEELDIWRALELERFEAELREEHDDAGIDLSEVTVDALVELPELTPCWVREVQGCDHEDCECSVLPLLDVLDWHLPAELHQQALDAHLLALGEAYAHFWTGHAVVEGRAEELGSACANCLVQGTEHLDLLLEEAGDLALGVGEALAAFHTAVILGEGRFGAQMRPR